MDVSFRWGREGSGGRGGWRIALFVCWCRDRSGDGFYGIMSFSFTGNLVIFYLFYF